MEGAGKHTRPGGRTARCSRPATASERHELAGWVERCRHRRAIVAGRHVPVGRPFALRRLHIQLGHDAHLAGQLAAAGHHVGQGAEEHAQRAGSHKQHDGGASDTEAAWPFRAALARRMRASMPPTPSTRPAAPRALHSDEGRRALRG